VRSSRGQASLEYVGLLALVVVVLSGTAALVNWGLGERILWTIRTGLCIVAHTACPPPPSDSGALSPCLETRDSSTQNAGVSLAVVALGGGLSVLREEYSDGHVELTFTDDGHAGLTAGIGAGFSFGPAKGKAEAGADASLVWTKGRKWRFPGRRAADAFLDHYGSDQKLLGRAVNDARRLCWKLCDAVGLGVDDPPDPDERFDEVGGHADAAAEIKLIAKGDAGAAADAALGWRRSRGGGGSLYLKLGAEGAGQLLVLGAGASPKGRAAGTIEVEYDAHHRPVALRLTGAGLADVGAHIPGLVRDDGSRWLEVGAELDLRGGDGRRVVSDLLHALRPDRIRTAPGEFSALLRWIRSRATLTARTYRTTDDTGGIGGSVALGAKVGGELGHQHSTAALEGEWTHLPGSRWLPRADCRAA